MKKLIISMGAVLVAVAANASYLYWQVDSTDYAGMEGAGDVAGATIAYMSNGGSYVLGQTSHYDSYYVQQNAGTYESEVVNVGTAAPIGRVYAADIGSLDNSYSYYIELVNSTGDVLGRSDSVSASDLTSYISAAQMTADIPGVEPVSVWHYSGSYTAVPEPTSAILMLFGAAMLGLKRKNRSIA